MRFLVTGGAGFIGSNIVERLLKLGHTVRVVDNFSNGRFENIQDFINDIDFICGDLTDFKVAQKCVEDMEYIIHQAAINSVPRSIADPIYTNENAVTTTVNLFKAAVDCKTIKRIVQASSSSVYGNTPILPKKEDMIPNPLSPYAVAKLTQEYYAKAFNNVYGIEIISLRYFNVFGPKQNSNSPYSAVIPKFLKLMLQGKRPTIYGDGQTSRDFTFVDNVVDANMLATSCDWPGNADPINIACGGRISLNELIDMINNILGTNIVPLYESERTGDVKHARADIQKAKDILNFKCKVGIYEGLEKMTKWFRDNSGE